MFDSCRLHESEIQGQGNQRFFSLSSSLSRLVVAASRLALDLFREEKSRKTSGTRVSVACCQYFLLYNYGSESLMNRMPVKTFHVRSIVSSNLVRLPVRQKIAGFSPSDSMHSIN